MVEPIQGLWIGSQLSLMEILSIQSFLAHGHEYHLYVYDEVKNVPDGVTLKNAQQIIPEKILNRFKYLHQSGYAKFSDIFRYKLLYEKGGFWVDLDFVCLKPFKFKADYVFASTNWMDNSVRVAVGILKVPKYSEFIKNCYITSLKKIKTKKLEKMRHSEMGKELITLIIKEFRLESFIMPPVIFSPIEHWNFELLMKEGLNTNVISRESYAIHLFNGLWRRGLKLPVPLYKIQGRLRDMELYFRIFNFIYDFYKTKYLSRMSIQKPKYDKNRLYSDNTIYGKLQKTYLRCDRL